MVEENLLSVLYLILSIIVTSSSYTSPPYSSLDAHSHRTLSFSLLSSYPPLLSYLSLLSSTSFSSPTSSHLPHPPPPSRFSWRVLWFVGIPTGLIMLPLCNNIPESFRFLVVRHTSERSCLILLCYRPSMI